ncbi:MAG: glycosyltransferase family 2 protein [Bacteroidota bacterium]
MTFSLRDRFSRQSWLYEHLVYHSDWWSIPDDQLHRIKEGLKRFNVERPLVSICIPIWNEEDGLIKTLSSIASLDIPYPTELVFINNNSTDETMPILEYMGVNVINEPRQGIAHARLTGLKRSKGKYIICGDADTLYPSGWINHLVRPLILQSNVKCAYGLHAYLPTRNTSRISWTLYELTSFVITLLRRRKREFLNVHGCNFSFRRDEGLAVKGFEMSITRTFDLNRKDPGFVIFGEDGRMGRKLGEIGKLKLVSEFKAAVWTNPRRILKEDGSLLQALACRIWIEAGLIYTYLFGSIELDHTSDDIIIP